VLLKSSAKGYSQQDKNSSSVSHVLILLFKVKFWHKLLKGRKAQDWMTDSQQIHVLKRNKSWMKKTVKSWSYLARRGQTYPCIGGIVFRYRQWDFTHTELNLIKRNWHRRKGI